MPNKSKICVQPAVFRPTNHSFRKGSHQVREVVRTSQRTYKPKSYALKETADPKDAVMEKMLYDVLEACGVRVPKTYLVYDGGVPGKVSLASKVEPGSKELEDYIRNHNRELEWCHRNLVFNNFRTLGQSGELMNIVKNPEGRNVFYSYTVRGLREHFAPFLFIGDDAVVSNTLVVERQEGDKCFLDAIRIDPGEGVRSLKNQIAGCPTRWNRAIPTNFYKNIAELTLDRPFYESQCCVPTIGGGSMELLNIQDHPYYIFIIQ